MSEPKPEIPPGAMWRVVEPCYAGMFYRRAESGRYQIWSKANPEWTDSSLPWSLSKFDDRDLFEVVG